MIKMLKQSKNVSKNLPKTIFTQGTQKTLLSPDFQRQKEDLAACCLKILFFQTAQSFAHFAHVVLLTSCFFGNFPWLSPAWIWRKFLIKHRGLNITQFCSISVSFASMYFFFILNLRCWSFKKSFCQSSFLIWFLVIKV